MPGPPLSGERLLRLAGALYALFAGAAFLWGLLAGRPNLLFDRTVASWSLAGLGAAAGLGLGLVVAWLSRVSLRRCRWAKKLYAWFATVLGPITPRDALVLAALSATGEELLFRGALQPSLGLWTTTIIFALLHFPQQRGLWPWTASAGVLGLGLGLLRRWTGDLAGATLAHFLINWLNLRHLSQLAPILAGEKLPPGDPLSSMSDHEQNPGSEQPNGSQRSIAAPGSADHDRRDHPPAPPRPGR